MINKQNNVFMTFCQLLGDKSFSSFAIEQQLPKAAQKRPACLCYLGFIHIQAVSMKTDWTEQRPLTACFQPTANVWFLTTAAASCFCVLKLIKILTPVRFGLVNNSIQVAKQQFTCALWWSVSVYINRLGKLCDFLPLLFYTAVMH